MLSAVQAYGGGGGVTGHAEIVLLVIVAVGCLLHFPVYAQACNLRT